MHFIQVSEFNSGFEVKSCYHDLCMNYFIKYFQLNKCPIYTLNMCITQQWGGSRGNAGNLYWKVERPPTYIYVTAFQLNTNDKTEINCNRITDRPLIQTFTF